MGKIRITQIKSTIKRPKDQKQQLLLLGLGKINKSVEIENTPADCWNGKKSNHLVKVEEA
jgi:large subunit ribosomal protein L30